MRLDPPSGAKQLELKGSAAPGCPVKWHANKQHAARNGNRVAELIARRAGGWLELRLHGPLSVSQRIDVRGASAKWRRDDRVVHATWRTDHGCRPRKGYVPAEVVRC